MTPELKELLKRAVSVAYWRSGDIDTEDGTFAATDLDQMILLEESVHNAFGLEASEMHNIFKQIEEL